MFHSISACRKGWLSRVECRKFKIAGSWTCNNSFVNSTNIQNIVGREKKTQKSSQMRACVRFRDFREEKRTNLVRIAAIQTQIGLRSGKICLRSGKFSIVKISCEWKSFTFSDWKVLSKWINLFVICVNWSHRAEDECWDVLLKPKKWINVKQNLLLFFNRNKNGSRSKLHSEPIEECPLTCKKAAQMQNACKNVTKLKSRRVKTAEFWASNTKL